MRVMETNHNKYVLDDGVRSRGSTRISAGLDVYSEGTLTWDTILSGEVFKSPSVLLMTKKEPETGVSEDSIEPELLVDVEPGIKAKTTAYIAELVPELREKFGVVFAAYSKFGYADIKDNPVVITSGNDSLDEHIPGSYHKYNRAIDIRGKHVPDSILREIAAEIQEQLGKSYDVLAEIQPTYAERNRDHIHIEYTG